MAYNNGFPMGYQQYYPQYQQPYQSQPVQQNGLIWIQGEAAARAYLISPNTTVALWDTDSQTVYIKSSDASGMPSIKTLDYTFRENTPQANENAPKIDFATKDDITTLQAEISEIKEKLKHGKSSVQHDRKSADK